MVIMILINLKIENIFNIDEEIFKTDSLCSAETKRQSYIDFLRFS